MLKFTTFTVLLGITLLAHTMVAQYNRAITLCDVQRASMEILEQQIVDMESALNEFRNAKTYEDGLRDALVYKDEILYVEGYHRGLKHGADHVRVSEESRVTSN